MDLFEENGESFIMDHLANTENFSREATISVADDRAAHWRSYTCAFRIWDDELFEDLQPDFRLYCKKASQGVGYRIRVIF